MQRPPGVTILAILAFIATGLLVLGALYAFVGGSLMEGMAARPGMDMIAGIGAAFVGACLLGFAVLYAVIGTGMLKLWNWDRILVIVLSALGACLNAIGVLTALVHFHPFLLVWRLVAVGINVWIALYLLKPHVKQAFGASGF